MKQAYPRLALARLCQLFGVTRQAYYQYQWNQADTSTETIIILDLVKIIRREQPKMGTRKLLILLEEDLLRHQIKIGRDALFDLLASEGMLIRRRKRSPHTTFSNHWLRKYDNLIVGFEPYSAHQLWVCDITYIHVGDGFAYLSLITDAYSHKIVGYHLASNLSAHGSVSALRMALSQLPANHKLIHHSDRGIQYCSHEYVKVLKENEIHISMTQSGSPYENAMAERVNGILKGEFLKDRYLDLHQVENEISEYIKIYNEKRPHMSCGFLTPEQAHAKTGALNKIWKKPREEVDMK